ARNHPRRWHRFPTAPDHPGGQQAAGARLRQADDLLPALDADARRHPRGADHHHSPRGRGVPPPARGRLAVRHQHHLRGAAEPRRPRAGLPHRRGARGRPEGRPRPGRQHLLRHRPRHPARGLRRHRRGRGVRLPRRRPDGVRRRGVRRPRPGRLAGGEAGEAQEQLRRAGAVLLCQRRHLLRQGARAVGARGARDHRPQPPLPR
ncbi:MAG: Glucose-1-phosphate thymidylyltransferase, partial [uncultured Acidimicrobiales bacterium]